MNKPLTDKNGEVRELNQDDFAKFRPASEMMGKNFMAMVRGKQIAPTKQSTTIRLDTKIIEHFKAGGKGWQTRINDALLKLVEG